MDLSGVMKVLGGQKVLGKRIKSRMDLLELSKSGVPKKALAHLAKYMSLSVRQMAEFLPVTERTIQRYGPETHFNRVVSEQILQIAEVAARGVEVFEGTNKFLWWMNHPNKTLANKTPASLLSSRFGIQMVLDELGRLEHGMFS